MRSTLPAGRAGMRSEFSKYTRWVVFMVSHRPLCWYDMKSKKLLKVIRLKVDRLKEKTCTITKAKIV